MRTGNVISKPMNSEYQKMTSQFMKTGLWLQNETGPSTARCPVISDVISGHLMSTALETPFPNIERVESKQP